MFATQPFTQQGWCMLTCAHLYIEWLWEDTRNTVASGVGVSYFYSLPSCPISISSLCACIQFSSVAQSCPTLCDRMGCSTPGFRVHHQLLELAQTHVHWVSDAIQPSHLLSSPSPPAFNLSQHQGLFQWVSSSLQVARVLEFQFQHQSFQWIFRVEFL